MGFNHFEFVELEECELLDERKTFRTMKRVGAGACKSPFVYFFWLCVASKKTLFCQVLLSSFFFLFFHCSSAKRNCCFFLLL